MPIQGIGTVEWIFRAGKQNIAIKTKYYYVPGFKARLISPQSLFNKKQGVIGKFTCLEDNAYLQFNDLPKLIIEYDAKSRLPISTARNETTTASPQINRCVTDDENNNLSPTQKYLLH